MPAHSPILAILMFALAGVAVAAEEESRTCDGDYLCVVAMAGADGTVDFRGQNTSAYPITLRLRVRPDNLVSERGNRVTTTLEAGASASLLKFRPRRAGRRTWYSYRFVWAVGRRDVQHDDDYRYRPPYAAGKRYRILQGYGSRFSHTGRETYSVDFNMPVGTAVHAAREGVVARVVEEHGEGCWEQRCADKANFVVVLHDDGSTGEYYHLVKDGVLVEAGERVKRGQQIALSGNSGHSTMPHLHFGVYEVDDKARTQSIAVHFDSEEGVVRRPRRGRGFTARDAVAR